jgi:hypothetical protein
MIAPSRQFHLVSEPLLPAAGGAGARAPRSKPPGIPVPAGVSRVSPGGGAFGLVQVPDCPSEGLLLEPFLAANHQLCLLVVNSAAVAVRVNDDLAPCVFVLGEGDSFGWGDAVIHVAVFRRPPIRAAGESGPDSRPCPVCLGPLAADDVAYFCDCGAVYHCHPSDSPRLQCAQNLSRCLACDRELILRESFTDLSHLGL